jgi:hypothetical protein
MGRKPTARRGALRLLATGAMLLAAGAVILAALRGSCWTHANPPAGPGVTDAHHLVSSEMVWDPKWSPDGQFVAYARERLTVHTPPGDNWFESAILRAIAGREYESHWSLWVVPGPGGARRQVPLDHVPFDLVSSHPTFCWSHDSRSLMVTRVRSTGPRDADGTPSVQGAEDPKRYSLEVYAVDLRDGTCTEVASVPMSPVHDHFRPVGFWLTPDPSGRRLALDGRDPITSSFRLAIIDLETGKLIKVGESAGDQMDVLAGPRATWGTDGRIYFEAIPRGEALPSEIWSVDEDGGSPRQETVGPDDRHPAADPIGTRLAFFRGRNIYLREANGTVRPLVEDGYQGRPGWPYGPVTWSPDGERIAFQWNVNYRTSIWTAKVLPLEAAQTE